MITVEDWAEIRRLKKVDNLSNRAIARRLGIHRNTVKRALAAPEPPKYERGKQRSLLDPYKEKIEALLAEDSRLSAVRVYEILEGEGYQGKLTILRDYLREVRGRYQPREVYVRMIYEPGKYAQVDWGEMPQPVLWQGVWCKVYAFVMVLCYSRLLYVEFSLSSKLADFLRCHQNGLHYFGGSPQQGVYDNLSSVVKKRKGAEIVFNERFAQFAGYYTLRPHVCWPGAPHEKGVVERPIGYLKQNFWAGRSFADFADLSEQGRIWLDRTANARVHATTKQVPWDHFEQERAHLLSLPAEEFDTDWVLYPRVSKDCVVRVQTNDYSVPWRIAQQHQQLEVRVDGQWVRLLAAREEVARHKRHYGKHQQILEPSHYQGLWQNRKRASFERLKAGFLTAYGQVGQHFYDGLQRQTQNLQSSLETILKLERQYPHLEVVQALQMAVAQGYFDALAVEYLLRAASLRGPSAAVTPTVIEVEVEQRPLSRYDALVGGAS